MTHSFEYHPIETAPMDKNILLFCPRRGEWRVGKWDVQEYHPRPNPFWNTWASGVLMDRLDQPIYWAEIADLVPKGIPNV